MEWLKLHVQGIENRLQGVETHIQRVETRVERTETRVQGLETRAVRTEDAMPGLATKVDLEVLRGETNTRIEALRSEMLRAFWIQGLALATLIIGLAGTMLGLAG